MSDDRETARRARAIMGELQGPPVRLPSAWQLKRPARRLVRLRRIAWLMLARIVAGGG